LKVFKKQESENFLEVKIMLLNGKHKKKTEIINSICKKYNIILMYLFGSHKENGYKLLNGEDVVIEDPLADIDVGVVFSYDINEVNDRYKLYSNIYNDLIEMIPKLDLVFLQENHSVFQTEAILGICIYAKSEAIKDDYELKTLAKAADFKYVLDKFCQERLEEL
jgi:predicted nucleotidyltransferase